ncbi:MAG: hypothetical protein AAFS07_05290 [Pseudomonadota bacterium]
METGGTAPVEALRADMARLDVEISAPAWAAVCGALSVTQQPAGAAIFAQVRIASAWLFVTEGITASQQTRPDGGTAIARFFEPGQLCGNLTSTWRREIAADDLVAITDVTGVLLPDTLLKAEYLSGGAFGRYLRLKIMETLLFDKDLICAKTSIETELRYRFLEQRHRSVIGVAPQKDIARFLGITPQGLSRFLRNRRLRAS